MHIYVFIYIYMYIYIHIDLQNMYENIQMYIELHAYICKNVLVYHIIM